MAKLYVADVKNLECSGDFVLARRRFDKCDVEI